MNSLVILLISIVVLVGGYLFYGKWLAKQWGVDPSRETPAPVSYTHLLAGMGALNTGGHGGRPAVGGLLHVAVEILVREDGAAQPSFRYCQSPPSKGALRSGNRHYIRLRRKAYRSG